MLRPSNDALVVAELDFVALLQDGGFKFLRQDLDHHGAQELWAMLELGPIFGEQRRPVVEVLGQLRMVGSSKPRELLEALDTSVIDG